MNHAAIVERIHQGRSTVVLGGMPDLPETITVVRVRCDLPGKLAPLERACNRIERLLDGETAPRQDLLRKEGGRPIAERFASACNRLASRAPGSAVLALDGIEAADAATHRLLAQLLRDRATFRLPVLLVARAELPASFDEIVEALEVPAAMPAKPSAKSARPRQVGARIEPNGATMQRVLRAAAVCGESFSVEPIARLLAIDPDEVLEALQSARDAGIAIREDAGGRFALRPDLAKMLKASLLPSLRARWEAQLGAPPATPSPGAREDAPLAERLDGVSRLVRAGDIKRASEELALVLAAIAELPAWQLSSQLSARATLERARLRWLGAGVEPELTLDGAFAEALTAHAAFGDGAPPKARADAAAVVAGIAYDLGDGASVERATVVLAETIATLLRDGATVEAAMLLNDQAALELRIGRFARARELAGRSLALLGARVKEAPTDATARADLAATHHLLARMPLHDGEKTRDPHTIATALAHVADAENAYRALAMPRDLGRAIETRARLEAKRGRYEPARLAFETALRLADDAADLTGLARVTAGLAELLAEAGKPRDALGLLASSIELNREKASPIGLAFDERTLGRIEDTIGVVDPGSELAIDLARTRERLLRALDLDAGVMSWTA